MMWATLSLIPMLMLMVGIWLSYFLRIKQLLAIAISLLITGVCGAGLLALANSPADGIGFQSVLQHRLSGDYGPGVIACVLLAANIGFGMVAKLYRVAMLSKAMPAEIQLGTGVCGRGYHR